MFLKHFCITFSTIGALIGGISEDWSAFCCFLIALIVNGIYLIDERIKELKNFYHDSLLNDIVPFWLNSDLIDKEYGGFITSVDREGKQYNTHSNS